jgi:hypothetical protein
VIETIQKANYTWLWVWLGAAIVVLAIFYPLGLIALFIGAAMVGICLVTRQKPRQ